MAKYADVVIILGRMAHAYGTTITADQARAYHTVLGDYPRMVLITATTQLMASSKFFPRPSEIIQLAKRINHEYVEPEWAKIDEAMNWYLYVHNLTSTDELTEEAIQKIYQSAGIDIVEEIQPEMTLAKG